MKNLIFTVEKLIKQNRVAELKKIVNETELLEVLLLFKELWGRRKKEELVVVFRLLNKEKSLQVFEQLEIENQEYLIAAFNDEKATDIVKNMAPDDRVKLLDELPAKVAKKLLNALTPQKRQQTFELLGYASETAGRVMTPEYIRLRKDITVEEALEKIRAAEEDSETIFTLYVTDKQRKLIGVVSLRELVKAKLNQKVEDIMTTSFVAVSTETDQEQAARILQERDLLAVPVVDSENRLVGIITIDDAMDILEAETTEDIFSKAGLIEINQRESLRSSRLLSSNIFEISKIRLPFLLITLTGGMLAGAVIGIFEEALEAVTMLALFIPVIMDMGGNVGTQSSTIFTRALVLGQISLSGFFKVWLREFKNGVFIGSVLGILGGLVAYLWQGIVGLGLAVGFAIFSTISIAAGLGFFVPWLLIKLGFDQAAGADPVITTIKDMSGLAIYFFFATLFLRGML